MIGRAIVQSAGLTVFQKPKAINLDGNSGYFQSDVVRRMLDDKELNSWSRYRGSRIPRDLAGVARPKPLGYLAPYEARRTPNRWFYRPKKRPRVKNLLEFQVSFRLRRYGVFQGT